MAGPFSERLLEQIKARNFSQKKLAQEAGVTEAAISHYIKGDRYPRATVMARIADALGTTSDYLINGDATNVGEEVSCAKRLIARNAAQMSREEKMEIIGILLGED